MKPYHCSVIVAAVNHLWPFVGEKREKEIEYPSAFVASRLPVCRERGETDDSMKRIEIPISLKTFHLGFALFRQRREIGKLLINQEKRLNLQLHLFKLKVHLRRIFGR